ncbi:efflux RND transporter periplasmic adaptor subunit [Rapidithrix thailandica]|uniref:Efflux RND transporter periplasmic adaptor subunit n=1 Tax=Rapidithrix thailandica TaxID=413964 RepID=A0AAW9RW45_9BACT
MITRLNSLAIIIASIIGIASCGNPTAQNRPAASAVPVNVQKVAKQNVVYHNEYPATVVALNEVELRSEVGGYITGISFKEGQKVKRGQRLYTLDQRKYTAAKAQAEANLKVAKANLEKAQKDADRYTALSEKDAIAKQQLDYALTELDNAKSRVAAAEADLVTANTNLRYSVITAPFDGTIGISNVRIGTFVSLGQTLLNTISSDNPMGVDFVIDEKELNKYLALEQSADNKEKSVFTIALPDKSLYGDAGEISVIDRAVDPQTGTIKIRLVFPNAQRKLRAGISATVRVLNENSGEQIMIPYKAVTEQMSENFVFVEDNGVVKQTRIELGKRIHEKVIVKSGLQVGQNIVVEGIQKLRDGVPVQAAFLEAGEKTARK